MSFNVLKKAPYGSKSKTELSAPVIRFPYSYYTNDREREGEKRPRSPGIRLSTPTSLAGRLIARLPVHVQLAINANVGILLVASSQIFMVGMGLSAKYFVSTTEISTLTLIMVRMLITAACCIGWLAAEGKEEHVYLGPPAIRKLLVWRGLTGFASLYASMQSLRGLSVSDSTTIQFLAPNLTAALGFVMLGETLGWRDIVAGMTCLGGVMLISRPAFLFGVPAEIASGAVGTEVDPAERTAAVIWALISVACSALSCTSFSRRLLQRRFALQLLRPGDTDGTDGSDGKDVDIQGVDKLTCRHLDQKNREAGARDALHVVFLLRLYRAVFSVNLIAQISLARPRRCIGVCRADGIAV